MVGKQDLVLVLEEYEWAFSVRLLDRNGVLFSESRFPGNPSVAEVRTLIGTLTHIFGNFNRVTYSRDFRTIWDHEARPDSFGKFMAELFASHKEGGWDGFSEFLARQERKVDPREGLPF